jgi:hypothetical protein
MGIRSTRPNLSAPPLSPPRVFRGCATPRLGPLLDIFVRDEPSACLYRGDVDAYLFRQAWAWEKPSPLRLQECAHDRDRFPRLLRRFSAFSAFSAGFPPSRPSPVSVLGLLCRCGARFSILGGFPDGDRGALGLIEFYDPAFLREGPPRWPCRSRTSRIIGAPRRVALLTSMTTSPSIIPLPGRAA